MKISINYDFEGRITPVSKFKDVKYKEFHIKYHFHNNYFMCYISKDKEFLPIDLIENDLSNEAFDFVLKEYLDQMH